MLALDPGRRAGIARPEDGRDEVLGLFVIEA